jgi:hypothetical protein
VSAHYLRKKFKMELPGKNIVVWDAEIKNVIDGQKVTWRTHDKMGISVACLFDFRTMDYCVYMDDNLEELVTRLNEADLVSGFNINGFDIPLLNAIAKSKLRSDLPVYDLLDEVRHSIGYRPGMKFPAGCKLDDVLLGTFGKEHMKTENGADAPIFWQEGKVGKVVTYCLADVKRESKTFMHAWKGLPVTTATHGSHKLRDPRQFMKLKEN